MLFSSQPFVTKLANTLSAWVLLIGDVSEFTSCSAAREEMEYELFGASMICSTWSERLNDFIIRRVSRGWHVTYQCSEVGYLEGRIVARDTSNFIVPTIDLESCSTFTTCGMMMVGLGEHLTRAYMSFPVTSLRIRESSRSRGSSDLLRLAKNSPQSFAILAFIWRELSAAVVLPPAFE